MLILQLGVSSVSELRQALGATIDVLPKKQATSEFSSDGNEKPVPKEPDSLVYTDSSTFLKVCFVHFINSKFSFIHSKIKMYLSKLFHS